MCIKYTRVSYIQDNWIFKLFVQTKLYDCGNWRILIVTSCTVRVEYNVIGNSFHFMCKCFTFLLRILLYVYLACFSVISGVYVVYIVLTAVHEIQLVQKSVNRKYFLALNFMPIQSYAIHFRKDTTALWLVHATWMITFRTILINSVSNKEVCDVLNLNFTNR